MHRHSSGVHGRALALQPAPRSLVVVNDEHQDDKALVPRSSHRFDRFSSSQRNVRLHTYDPNSRRPGFVEVKIDGHQSDPIRIEYTQLPRGPQKNAPVSPTRQSRSFESRDKPVLVYAPVKIGGHALDHVRFLDRGMPSRPLWGYAGPRVVFQSLRPQSSGNLVVDRVHPSRGLTNLYDCSHCLRVRQSPRIQLCCGHAVCASCLTSDSMRHVVTDDGHGGLCLLECVQCNDFVAMDAVVFSPDRIIRTQWHGRDASTRSLRDLTASTCVRRYPLDWKSGSALAALAAVAAGRLLTKSKPSTTPSPDVALHDLDVAVDIHTSVATGVDRWQRRTRSVDDPSCKLLKYSFVRTLGVGNFAEVMLVRNRKGALCVLKESDKLPEAVNEIHILTKIHHAHVVRVHDYFAATLGHRQFAYIEMEYCDQGDLAQLLAKRPLANDFHRVFHQVCLGLAEIHRHGIVHRDLKPGNVLLTSDGVVKVADFGVSTWLESDLLTHHAAGTVAFMAPEVRRFFLGESVSYDTTADIWSLGALAVAMLSGDPEPRVATRPVDEVVGELVDRHGVSDHLATVLKRMLAEDPRQRPTLAELVELVPMTTARL